MNVLKPKGKTKAITLTNHNKKTKNNKKQKDK